MWWSKQQSRTSGKATPQREVSKLVRRAPLMMQLEPRFMFDGVAATHAEAPHVSGGDHGFLFDHVRTVTASSIATSRSVVFVDSSVPNYQELISGLPSGTPYVVLNSSGNGLNQILQYLEANQGVTDVHLISHGTEGAVQVGSVWLNSSDLSEYSAQLAEIGEHMAPGGSLLLYGCDVAEGTVGQTFVQQIAAATHLNVAANTNPTGSPALGGTWTLDYDVGKVNSGILLSTAVEQQYGQLLGLTTENFSTETTFQTTAVYSFTLGAFTYTLAGTGGPWENDVAVDPSLQQLGDETPSDYSLAFDSLGQGGISSITITKSGGGAFDMNSLDLDAIADANLTIQASGGTSGEITATSNGNFVTQTFSLGGSGNSATATAFEDTTSVVITGGNLQVNLGHVVYGPAILPAATVSSVTVPSNGTYHIGQTLDFDVNFSGNVTVTGTPDLPITLTTGGTVDAHYVSGSGTSTLVFAYTIVSGEQSPAGITLGSSLTLNGGSIIDANSENATLTLNNVASTSSIDVQAIPPAIDSINRTGSSTNTGGSEQFSVTFSEAVTGVTTSDFTLATTGSINDSGITSATTSDGGTIWTVTVGGVSGYGTLGLNLNSSGTNITDQYTNQESGGFTGQTYTIHSAPILTAGSGNSGFTESNPYTGNTAVDIDSGITLTDAGSSSISSATVTLTNAQTGDTLGFVNTNTTTYGHISGSYSGDVLTLTSTSGSPTLAQWEAALAAVTFDNTVASPNTTTRDFTFSVTDGNSLSSNSLSETMAVTHTDQSPVVSTSGSTVDYVANASAVTIDSSAAVTESDGTQVTQVTVTISSGYQSGDLLAFTGNGSTGDITAGAFNTSNHTITLSSSDASISAWNAAMQAVQFSSSAGTGSRTISFAAANAGSENSNTATDTVDVTPQPPHLSMGGGNSGFTESNPYTGNTAITIDSGLDLTAGGSNTMTGATISFAGGTYHSGEDVLSLSGSFGNIQASFDSATGTLTLTSAGNTASAANWKSALDAVQYIDTAASPNTSTRQFSFSITDSNTLTSNVLSETVAVSHTDQSPVVTTSAGTTSYVANAPATTIDGSVAVTESDGTALSSVVVTIGSGAQASDVLNFVSNAGSMGNISGSYDSATHTLTLSSSGSSASLTQWDAALEAVQFSTSGTNGDRTITFVATNAGSETSNTASKTVDVAPAAPALAAGGGNSGFTEVDPYTSNTAVTIDSGMTLTPGGSSTILSATVTLNNAQTGDSLAFINTSNATFGNISGSYSSGVLTLSSAGNTASAMNWQAALDAVTFDNNVGQPSTTTRSISISVADGNSLSSNSLSETVAVSHTDQSPVVTTTSGAANFTLGGSAITVDSGLTVSEADSTALSSVTLTIGSGAQAGDTLNFVANAGTMGNINGVFSGTTLTLTSTGSSASIVQWNAALDAVQFTATAGAGSRTIAIVATNTDSETSNTADKTVTVSNPAPPPVTPVVESVTVPTAAVYTAGETLNFTVNFNEAVDVQAGTGLPRLSFTLNGGQTVYANYVSGSGTSSLTFSYVVAQGAMETTGLSLTNSIDSQNSVIEGTAGNAAVLTLNDVGDGSLVYIDGMSPAVTSIDINGAATTTASSVTYTVNFNEAVSGVNAGDFTLTATGSAGGTIASVVPVGSGGDAFTVTVNNISGLGTLRLDLNPSSGVADLAGTKVPGFVSGQTYSVDRVDSTVANVQVPAAGDYLSGQTLNFDVNFTQAVTVDSSNGVPSITITLSSGQVQAHYVSGSGTDILVFSYTVGANDKAPNGIKVGGSISANGASLTGADGNPAVLGLHSIGLTNNIDIGVTSTGGGSSSGGTGSTGGTTGNGGSSGSSGNSGGNDGGNTGGNSGGNSGSSGGSTTTVGTGLPLLPNTGNEQTTSVVNPFVWVVPPPTTAGTANHGESVTFDTSPATAQDTWSSAPLVSAGQTTASNNDAVGSSGFTGNVQTPVDQAINPSAVELPALGNGNVGQNDLLNWQAPQNIEPATANSNTLGVIDTQRDGAFFAPRTAQTTDTMLAQMLGRQPGENKAATERHDAANEAQAALPAGKASLSQQFSRFGKDAREHDKAALVKHAQRVAQGRGG